MSRSGLVRVSSIVLFLVAASAVQEAAFGGEPPKPTTTADVSVAPAELGFLVQPLTKEQLVVEADGWRDILLAKVLEVSKSEIAITKAKAEEKDKLLEARSKLQEERTLLIDRLNVVLKALRDKGGDVAGYEKYVAAVSGISLDVKDTSAAWAAILGWLKSEQGGIRWGINIVLFILVLIAAKVVASLIAALTRKGLGAARGKISDLLRDFIVNSTRKVVMLIGLVVALSMLEVNIAPLLAGIGVIGFVLGFALQNTLSNFAAGFMILLYRPYDMHDMVTIAGTTGKVETMSLVSTTLRNKDDHTVVIPNGSIWSGIITNQHKAPDQPAPAK
jgi:small conductance mechanosensitive channel